MKRPVFLFGKSCGKVIHRKSRFIHRTTIQKTDTPVATIGHGFHHSIFALSHQIKSGRTPVVFSGQR
jgi:hypothetical protein